MSKGIIKFTKRELEVMEWSARGKTYEEIARLLSITEDTAKAHMENARNKLGAINRIHAIALAVAEEYIKLSS